MVDPEVGDVVHIAGRASVQFAGSRAVILRVTAVCRKPTYEGWCWLTGYVLDRHGEAVERREVFVQRDGLRLLSGRDRRPVKQVRRPAAGSSPVVARMEGNRGVRYPGQAR
ncbi:hypothetical protein ACFHW1_03325 [Micromonospora sp. LOL_014]|uniref:hypothetical protein n=1 Tax=Micromonospora sp. LOL_014 TaxID=3345415 RepID=UPI003A8803EA